MHDRDVSRLLGHNLRAAREDADMSQEALAAAAGINRAALGKVERGEVQTQVITLMKLAGALERDPGDLLPEVHWRSATVTGDWE